MAPSGIFDAQKRDLLPGSENSLVKALLTKSAPKSLESKLTEVKDGGLSLTSQIEKSSDSVSPRLETNLERNKIEAPVELISIRPEGAGQNSTFCAFTTLNPRVLTFAYSEAWSPTVSGRVGSRLAISEFGSNIWGIDKRFFSDLPKDEWSAAVGEHALLQANLSVYQLGAKLSAWGRVAASMLTLVIAGAYGTVSRTARGSAYLLRKGVIHPFFPLSLERGSGVALGVGQELIPEIVSVKLLKGDLLILCANDVSPGVSEALLENFKETLIDSPSFDDENILYQLKEIYQRSFSGGEAEVGITILRLRK
jgi:hypothetical protein